MVVDGFLLLSLALVTLPADSVAHHTTTVNTKLLKQLAQPEQDASWPETPVYDSPWHLYIGSASWPETPVYDSPWHQARVQEELVSLILGQPAAAAAAVPGGRCSFEAAKTSLIPGRAMYANVQVSHPSAPQGSKGACWEEHPVLVLYNPDDMKDEADLVVKAKQAQLLMLLAGSAALNGMAYVTGVVADSTRILLPLPADTYPCHKWVIKVLRQEPTGDNQSSTANRQPQLAKTYGVLTWGGQFTCSSCSVRTCLKQGVRHLAVLPVLDMLVQPASLWPSRQLLHIPEEGPLCDCSSALHNLVKQLGLYSQASDVVRHGLHPATGATGVFSLLLQPDILPELQQQLSQVLNDVFQAADGESRQCRQSREKLVELLSEAFVRISNGRPWRSVFNATTLLGQVLRALRTYRKLPSDMSGFIRGFRNVSSHTVGFDSLPRPTLEKLLELLGRQPPQLGEPIHITGEDISSILIKLLPEYVKLNVLPTLACASGAARENLCLWLCQLVLGVGCMENGMLRQGCFREVGPVPSPASMEDLMRRVKRRRGDGDVVVELFRQLPQFLQLALATASAIPVGQGNDLTEDISLIHYSKGDLKERVGECKERLDRNIKVDLQQQDIWHGNPAQQLPPEQLRKTDDRRRAAFWGWHRQQLLVQQSISRGGATASLKQALSALLEKLDPLYVHRDHQPKVAKKRANRAAGIRMIIES
eukprot:gene1188-1525_t